MRATFALLAVASWGCSAAGSGALCKAPELVPLEASSLGYLGAAVQFRVSLKIDPACSDPGGDPTAELEVFDPDNRRLAGQVVGPEYFPQQQLWLSSFFFSPQRVGLHHVLVTLGPSYGIVQNDVLVVRPQRAQNPRREQLDIGCARTQLTNLGALVCEDVVGQVGVYRGGMRVQSFSAGTEFRVSGNRVWLLGPGGLFSVYEDHGSGILILASDPITVPLGVLAAVGDDLALGQPGTITRYRARDGGVDPISTTTLEDAGRAWAVAFDPDAGTALFAAQDQWTRVDLAPGDTRVTPVWHAGAEAAFEDDDGLWLVAPTGAVTRVPADPRKRALEATPGPGWTSIPTGPVELRAGSRPFFRPPQGFNSPAPGFVVVPERLGDGIDFEAFEAPLALEFVEITGHWLRASNGYENQLYPLPD